MHNSSKSQLRAIMQGKEDEAFDNVNVTTAERNVLLKMDHEHRWLVWIWDVVDDCVGQSKDGGWSPCLLPSSSISTRGRRLFLDFSFLKTHKWHPSQVSGMIQPLENTRLPRYGCHPSLDDASATDPYTREFRAAILSASGWRAIDTARSPASFLFSI